MDEAALPSMEALLGQFASLQHVRKLGEGTFGEAFKAEQAVFKIVPLEGSLLVNGEVQKRSEEILAEVAIALTLSRLREPTGDLQFMPLCVHVGVVGGGGGGGKLRAETRIEQYWGPWRYICCLFLSFGWKSRLLSQILLTQAWQCNRAPGGPLPFPPPPFFFSSPSLLLLPDFASLCSSVHAQVFM